MLSDTELAQLEAELEEDLEATSFLETSNENVSLDGLLRDIEEASNLTSHDELNDLPGFILFTQSQASIDSTRQDSLALVQEFKAVLDEGYVDGTSDTEPSQQEGTLPDAVQEVYPVIEERETLTRVASIEDFSQSTAVCNNLPETRETHIGLQNSAADSSADVYWNRHHASAFDVLLEEIAIDANRKARIIKEKHRLRRLRLDIRHENIRLNRNAWIVQKWYRRAKKSARQVFITSIVPYMKADSIPEMSTRITTVANVISFPEIASSSNISIVCQGFDHRELSLRHVCQLLHSIGCSYQYIILQNDSTEYRMHVFILCNRKIMHFIVYLPKMMTCCSGPYSYINSMRLQPTTMTALDSNGVLFFRCEGKIILDYLQCITSFMHAIIAERRNSPQLTTLSSLSVNCIYGQQPTRMIRYTSKPDQILKRVLTRRAFEALRFCNAAVKIQCSYRGFLIRRRLDSIRSNGFDYYDSELESILCANIQDLVHFDEVGLESDDWNPCRPTIESLAQRPSTSNASAEPPAPSEVQAECVTASMISSSTCTNSIPSFNKSGRPDEDGYALPPINPRPENKLISEWHIKDARVAQAMMQRKRHMKRKGSNGIAMRLRR